MVHIPARKLAMLLTLSAALAGCSSAPTSNDEAVFHESANDIVNRTPNSLSVPSDKTPSGGPVLDEVYLRTQADYHYTLAESFSLEGNAARATEEYKQTLIYDPRSAVVRLRLAAEFVKQGLVSEAIEQGKAALQEDAKYEDAHLLLGGLYSAMRMYDDALKEYHAVITNNPENYEAPMFIGALLAEQKKYPEALAQFSELAKDKENPSAHLAWYYIGRVYLEQDHAKNIGKAESAFHEALKIKPKHAESLLALGQLLEETGRKDQALKSYQVYQEKYGPSSEVADELSRLYIGEKDYVRAYQQLAIMESNDSSNLNVKAKMAFILIEQKKYNEAILRLEEVLAVEPSSDKIRFYLGAVYEEIKDYKSSIMHFEKVPQASSYFKEAVVHTAYLYKMQNNYSRAIETVQAGIKADGNFPQFYALYASLLDDQKQYKQAAEMLTKATEKFPTHAQLLFFLGNMQDHLGKREETIVTMKKVLEIDKDHVQALNFLAYTYADLGRDLSDAEKFARRALDLQPNDGYIMDTLGWVMFKRGNVSDAIRMLEAAYSIQPNESVIAEHLGDAYYHEQMPDKAKKYYRRAVETESNVSQADKVKAKIVSIDHQIIDDQSNDRKPASASAGSDPARH